jgi:hypothetical protein
VKLRALGTVPATPFATPQTPPAAPTRPETVAIATVAGRDADGTPTSIALPRPLAGRQVDLYVSDYRGRFWAAAVREDGTVGGDLKNGATPDRHLLGKLGPGSKIVASVGPDGRILALSAVGKRK